MSDDPSRGSGLIEAWEPGEFTACDVCQKQNKPTMVRIGKSEPPEHYPSHVCVDCLKWAVENAERLKAL